MDMSGRSAHIARMVEDRWGELLSQISADVVGRDADNRPLPKEFLVAAADQGLQALAAPAGIGGADMSQLDWGMVLEQIGHRCEDLAFPLVLSVQTTVARMLYLTGRADLVADYAIPIVTGRCAVSLAYTENADPFTMNTRLSSEDGSYVLNGHKTYVTGGLRADVLLTYARDDQDDLVVCLVRTTDPGVRRTPANSLGHRSTGAASVDFHDVVIPPERIIQGRDGLTHGQMLLNERRLLICCAPLGRAQAALQRCVARLSSTVRYGEPLAEMKNVQATLGRMYIAIEAARATLYNALDTVTRGEADLVFDPGVSAAKHFVTEQVLFVFDQAFRILGGQAYYGDPHFGRYLRDCVGLIASAGAQDILAVTLGAAAVARWRTDPTTHPNTPSEEHRAS